MAKEGSRYPKALRREVIDRVRTGQTPKVLAQRFGVPASTIRGWIRADAPDHRRGVARTRREQAELNHLPSLIADLAEVRNALERGSA